MSRTSDTNPLRIAELSTPAGGCIGLTFCPGKFDPDAMTGAWDRDLSKDLQVIADWGGRALVTLMESHELMQLRVAGIGEQVEALGMTWLHLPIRDVSIPDPAFEHAWIESGKLLRCLLGRGERLVIHCRGGLGRTGVVAGRLLIELGEAPTAALARVRAARPGAVQTCEQEQYLLNQSSLGACR